MTDPTKSPTKSFAVIMAFEEDALTHGKGTLHIMAAGEPPKTRQIEYAKIESIGPPGENRKFVNFDVVGDDEYRLAWFARPFEFFHGRIYQDDTTESPMLSGQMSEVDPITLIPLPTEEEKKFNDDRGAVREEEQ